MLTLLQSLKRVFRVEDWWYSKIPPLLGISFFLFLPLKVPLIDGLVTIFFVFASILCVAAYGHIVNDVFDVEADALAGKPNAMSTRNVWQRSLACLFPLIGGVIPGMLLSYPAWGWILLGLNFLWPTLYSIPPIRFKERGVGGLLLDAAGSHITPTLFVLVVFSHSFPGAEELGLTRYLVIAVWSAVLGIKGILYHQLADWQNDYASETKTWARSVDKEKLSRFLPRYNLAIELPANVALAISFLPWSPLSGILLIVYIVIETIKNRIGFEFAIDADPGNNRRAIPFCNDLFYDCWLLLSVTIHLALLTPEWAWSPIAIVLIFGRNYRLLLRDIGAVAGQLAQRMGRRRRHPG